MESSISTYRAAAKVLEAGMGGLAEILEENQRLRDSLAARDSELAEARQARLEAEAKVEALRETAELQAKMLELLRLKRSGPKSERFVPDGQIALFDGQLDPPPRAPVPAPELDAEPKKRKPKRRRLQDLNLPKRTVTCKVDPEAACARCGGELRSFGSATSHRVEWIPGHFEVHEVVREKCSCPACPGQGVLAAPSPYALVRASCANGLLTRVIVDKFADHLPLNRQVSRMKREGFAVATSTLSGWVAQSANLLDLLGRAIRSDVLSGDFVQSDDTGLPVQDGGNGRLRKGRLWVFTNQEHAWYGFSPTKEGVHPASLLQGFSGSVLLLDGGSEFNQVVRELGVDRAGCWSHLRRYFYEALAHHPVEARLAVDTIRDLFMLERSHRELTPEQRLEARQIDSKPLVDGFFAWVEALSTFVRPKSTLGAAITYARNQEPHMRVFLDEPALPLHNNLSELMLRQPIVGRKNWLFAGSEGGAKAACTLFSVISSCLLQGIDPQTYLYDIFGRLPDYPANRVHELIPREWRIAREQLLAG